jgi:hypothetical protein
MATMQKNDQNQRQGDREEGGGASIGSPISNDAYNIIAALHAKLEGLEAYRKFSRDGDTGVWQKLTEQDRRSVEILCDELERLVKDGKFREMGGSRAPGGGKA